MKKIRVFMCLILVSIVFSSLDVFASTKVNIRTEDNYLVPDNVIVTESNKSAILSTPAVYAEEKVYDFADVLTETEESQLYNKIVGFINKTGMDLAVVTIKENPVNNAGNYAHNFYDYNYFKDNGLLLLIDFDTSEIYMTTSGSAYDLFPNSRMEPILESVYNNVVAKKFYAACEVFVNAVGGYVEIGEATRGEDIVIDTDGTIHKESKVLQALVFALIGTVIVMIVLVSRNRMVKPAVSSKDFLNKETMEINQISDVFTGTRTTKTPRSSDSSSSSRGRTGSFGGRSGGRSGVRSGGAGRKF